MNLRNERHTVSNCWWTGGPQKNNWAARWWGHDMMWGVQPSREDKKMITEVGLKQKSHSQKRRGSQQFLKRLNSTSKLTFSPSVFDLIQNWFFLFFGDTVLWFCLVSTWSLIYWTCWDFKSKIPESRVIVMKWETGSANKKKKFSSQDLFLQLSQCRHWTHVKFVSTTRGIWGRASTSLCFLFCSVLFLGSPVRQINPTNWGKSPSGASAYIYASRYSFCPNAAQDLFEISTKTDCCFHWFPLNHQPGRHQAIQ